MTLNAATKTTFPRRPGRIVATLHGANDGWRKRKNVAPLARNGVQHLQDASRFGGRQRSPQIQEVVS